MMSKPEESATPDPCVSVVIPTCDRRIDWLREAIASVLKQSLPPLEVLVIDNGTREVARSDLPSGIKLFREQPRIGPSRARNLGASLSTGTHLAFLDDDDWWDENFLFEAFNACRRDSARCVYGRILRSRNGQVYEHHNLTEGEISVDALLWRNPGTGGINLLIEKDLFLAVGGFDEELAISEDRALAIEILRAGEKIAIAPEAVVFARQHDGFRLSKNIRSKRAFILKYRDLMPRWVFWRRLLKYRWWELLRSGSRPK